MKTLNTILCLCFASTMAGQCPFTPTITPDPALACPIGFLQLYTQAGYDNYQWYENGSPILGATNVFLEVDASSIGNSFTVLCILDGCAELSAPVVLDGWIFLLPYVIHAGDPPYAIGFEGEQFFCEGDTALLIMGSPYTTAIQWTESGVLIPGATNDTLVVTQSGVYTVSGAPEVCPGYIQPLGLDLIFFFAPPALPVIIEIDDMLCIYPNDFTSHQWYLNGATIAGGECITPAITGTYTVSASYLKQCGPGTSEPYDFFLGMDELGDGAPLLLRPNPAIDAVVLSYSTALQGTWQLLDYTGREVLAARLCGAPSCRIELGGQLPGLYTVLISGPAGWKAARVVIQ